MPNVKSPEPRRYRFPVNVDPVRRPAPRTLVASRVSEPSSSSAVEVVYSLVTDAERRFSALRSSKTT